MLLVGDTSAKIKEAVLNEARNIDLDLSKILEIKEFEDLKSCVDYAKEKSQKGDMVVMSPASASFDMYKDFEERGNYFKDLINNL